MNAALVLGALLAAACVVYVAWPFLREPEVGDDTLREPGPLERRQIELAEERDRALAALKELEFDHRTGQIADEDYRALIGAFRRRAAEALRALEPQAAGRGSGADPTVTEAQAARDDESHQPLRTHSRGTVERGT